MNPESMDADTEWIELVGVEIPEGGKVPAGMSSKRLPGRKYAVFTHKGGIESIKNTYDYIYIPLAD